MQAEQNRSIKRRHYLRLRRSNTWLSVLLFFIATAFSVVLLSYIASILMQLSFESKLNSAAEQAWMMAGIYESGGEEAEKLFNARGITYTVLDKDGTTLSGNDNATRTDVSGYYERSSPSFPTTFNLGKTDLYLYGDAEHPILRKNRNGTVSFNYKTAIQTILLSDSIDRLTNGYEDKDEEDLHSLDLLDEEEADALPPELNSYTAAIRLPVWIAVDIHDGAQQMLLRVDLSFSFTDIMLVVILCIGLGTQFLVILGVMLYNILAGMANSGRMSRMLFTDLSTRGRNRIWFLFRGEQLLRSWYAASRRFAVADVTLVNYRSFCVCHSIAEGEQLLLRIYGEMCGQMKKKELCAHNADGSFALLLQYETKEELDERLHAMIRQLCTVDETHPLAFHAGIKLVSGTENRRTRREIDIEQEFADAGNACATLDGTDGSGTAFFDQKLVDEQRWVDTVTECQRRALEQEEFLVYYQPKYDPQTNLLCGAEALIRWQSPEHGFVSPGRFIPIFEKNGFITEIDHYMVSHVARDQRRWLDAGFTCVPVSVNVSRAHFIESGLAEQIRDMVDAEGTPHELIEIELTESAFFDDKKAMIRTITRLKEYGFAVSMDDFGSGYSSLNSLKDMPLDVLKLDAEFFRGEEAGTDRGEIVVSEAIKLAKSLHMRTVAEGVEVKEQVDFLASQGCDMIQGYYYAKPMPGADYEQRMIARQQNPEAPAEAPQEAAPEPAQGIMQEA